MSLKRNFSFGLASSIWGAVLALAVVPLYLKYLGTESYGLIGFFATTQALLGLLDMGLAPTITREVARYSASGIMREARNLLHTLATVYWLMACVIGLVVVALAPVIAQYWLQPQNLSNDTVAHALMLMGMVVACRWPVGLYMGALMGMQRIALASMLAAVAGTLSSLGAVLVLMFVSPTIEGFFIWQACVGLGYAIVMRWTAWRLLGRESEPSRFSLDNLKRIWRFSAGMSAISVMAVILTQMDKVLLSRMLSLTDFGCYMLAGTLANGLYLMLTPMYNALYPRMTALVAAGETKKLIDVYKNTTRLFLAVFFPVAIMAAFFSEDLLYLWTRNQQLASSTALIASLLLLGNALHSVMHFPFALQLAYGSTRLPITIALMQMAVFVPLVIVLALLYGATGGALAWLLLNVFYVFVGTWMTHKKLLPGQALNWLIHSVGYPFFISLIVVVAGWKLVYAEDGHVSNFFWGGGCIIVAALLNLALLPKGIAAKFKELRNFDRSVN